MNGLLLDQVALVTNRSPEAGMIADRATRYIDGQLVHGGQTCMAWTRIVVHDDQYDEAIERAAPIAALHVPGDPTGPTTRLGPMAPDVAWARVGRLVGAAVAHESEVLETKAAQL